MPTIIEGPTGRRFQFESDIPEARAFELAKQQHPEFFPEEIKAPAPARPDPGIPSEIGSILKSGAGQGIAGLGKLGQYAGIGGKDLEEYGAGMTKRATEALSPGTQAALQRQFLQAAPEGQGFLGYQLGDAKLTDIPAQFLQSVPVMAGTMAAAAGAAALAPASAVAGVGTGVLGFLGRVGLGKIAGRIATAAGAEAGAAEALAGKLAINTLAGNVAEGLAAAGSSGIETEKAISDFAKINPDGFFRSPIGQQALQDADGDKNKAIELGAFRAGRSAAALTGISTAILATPGSAFESLAVFGKGAKSGRLHSAIMGGVTEGPLQELPQGSAEQYIQNLQRIQAGEPISPGKGVLEAGVQGAIIGTPMGGALGAITGSGKAQKLPPLDTQFQVLASKYQENGLNATNAYHTAARDIEKYAQPGETLTVYDSLGRDIEATIVGKNETGKTIANVAGEEVVLGNEFTVSDPKDGRYGFKKGDEFVASSELNKDEVTAALDNIGTVIEQQEAEFAQTKVKTPEYYSAERQYASLTAADNELDRLAEEKKTQETEPVKQQKKAAKKPVVQAPATTPAPTAAPLAAPAAPVAAPIVEPPIAAPDDAVQAVAPVSQATEQIATKPSVTNVSAEYPLMIMRQEDDPNPFPEGMNFAVGNGVSDAMEYFKTVKEAETYRKSEQDRISTKQSRAPGKIDFVVTPAQVARAKGYGQTDVGFTFNGQNLSFYGNNILLASNKDYKDGISIEVKGHRFGRLNERGPEFIDELKIPTEFKDVLRLYAKQKIDETQAKQMIHAAMIKLAIISADFQNSRISTKQSRAPGKISKGAKKAAPVVRHIAHQRIAKMREARNKEYYTKALPRVTALIYKRMNQIGLGKHVSNEFLASIKAGKNLEVNGEYVDKIIKLAIAGKSDKQIMSTLDHEAIHAMREIGMITKDEWKNLSNLVDKRKWLDTFKIEERYKGKLNPTTADLKASGLTSEEWIKDAKYEEAIADAFSTYANGRSPVLKYDENNQPVYVYKKDLNLAGQPVGIINRILKILGIVKDVVSEDATFKRFVEAPIEADKLKAETASPKLSVANIKDGNILNRIAEIEGETFVRQQEQGGRYTVKAIQDELSDLKDAGYGPEDLSNRVIYGKGGYNRYQVGEDGSVRPIKSSFDDRKDQYEKAVSVLGKKLEETSPKLSVSKADLGREKTGQLYEVYNRKTGKVVGGPYQTRSTARSGADRNDNKYGGYAHDVREVEQPKFSVAPRIAKNIVKNNEGYWIYKGELPESFYKWFGNSVVTDKDGFPRVVFHGTARDITEFKPKRANAIFVTDDEEFADDFSKLSRSWMLSHIDQFITPDRYKELKDEAKKITQADTTKNEVDELYQLIKDELPGGENIMPLFVRAEKPFDYLDATHLAAVRKELEKNSNFSKQEIDLVLDTVQKGSWRSIEREEVQDAIREVGFDGFYVKEAGRVNLAVYDPNQVKSVTGNSGEYSRESKDIRRSVAPRLSSNEREQSTAKPSAKPNKNPAKQKFLPGEIALRDPIGQFLVITGSDIRAVPDHLASVVRSISQYNAFPTSNDPDTMLRNMHETIVGNLVWLYDLIPENIRARAKLWYDGANRIAIQMSDKYGYTPEQTAGVYAVLSPQKDWFMNVSLGDRVIAVFKERQNEMVSLPMKAWVDSYVKGSKTKADRIKRQEYAAKVRMLGSKRLKNMNDKEAALFIRTFDETYNPRQYRIITPEGGFLGFVTNNERDESDVESDIVEEGHVAWGSLSTIQKSVSILRNGSKSNISDQLGAMHKVRNFYNNILVPGSRAGHVTIDTHAVAAAFFKALSGASEEVSNNFGTAVSKNLVPEGRERFGPGGFNITGASGTYGFIADAYRDAASRVAKRDNIDLLPREMQSITWEAIRAIFPAAWKRENAFRVEDIYNRAKSGEITLEAARNEVKALASTKSGGKLINEFAWEQATEGKAVKDGGTSFDQDIDPIIAKRKARLIEPHIIRDKFKINLSAATTSEQLPGVAALYADAKAGSVAARRLLQEYAQDNLNHLLNGIEGIKISFNGAIGLYNKDTEPALSMTVSFPEEQRDRALAALNKFSTNFNQERFDVREKTNKDVGHVFDDGSYATAAVYFKIKSALNDDQVQELIDGSGLAGLTFGKDFVEAYYVAENLEKAADYNEYKKFDQSIGRLTELLGQNAGKVETQVQRIWPYGSIGTGYGVTAERRNLGSYVPESSQVNNKTIKRVADYLNNKYRLTLTEEQQKSVPKTLKSFSPEKELTPKQDALQSMIARFMDLLPNNNLKNKLVVQGYKNLSQALLEQYKAMPIKVEINAEIQDGKLVVLPDRYENLSSKMRKDIQDNNHLYIYPTTKDTFGPEGEDFSKHPLFAQSGLKDINGYPLRYNDLLRAVHDYYAHGMSGGAFGPLGEEAAWKTHMAMTPDPLARWALTMETRAQNSWINFRENIDRSTPFRDRQFSPQKAAFLPIEFALTGTPAIDASMKQYIATLTPVERLGSPVKDKITFNRLLQEHRKNKTDGKYPKYSIAAQQITSGKYSHAMQYPDMPKANWPLVPETAFYRNNPDRDDIAIYKGKFIQLPWGDDKKSFGMDHILHNAIRQSNRRWEQVTDKDDENAILGIIDILNAKDLKVFKESPLDNKIIIRSSKFKRAIILGENKDDLRIISVVPSEIPKFGKIIDQTPDVKMSDKVLYQYKNNFTGIKVNFRFETPPATVTVKKTRSYELPKQSIAPKFTVSPYIGATGSLGGSQIPTTFAAPASSKLTDHIYTWADKFVDLKNLQKEIEATIGQLDDQYNAYQKEELYHAKVAGQFKDFMRKEVLPLYNAMKEENVTPEKLNDYVHNRHAEERNIQIDKVNQGVVQGIVGKGSGIATQDARDYLNNLTAQEKASLDRVANMLDGIMKETRALMVSSGLEEQGTIDAWEKTYTSYVPLERVLGDPDETNTGFTGQGQGYSVSKSVKRAMGSTLDVEHIIANIFATRERTIVRAEKNEIDKAIYALAIKAPNPNIWIAVDPELPRNTRKNLASFLATFGGFTIKEAQNIAAFPETRSIDRQTGLVTKGRNPQLANADNVLHLMIDGKEKLVFFNSRNKQANRLVRTLKNLDTANLARGLQTVGAITRYFSAVNTQYNPIFGVVNLIRDVQTGLINLESTPIAGMQKQVAGDFMPAIKGIWSQLRAEAKGGSGTGPWAALFKEFEKYGGPTGYRDMFANSDDRAKMIESEIKSLSQGKTKTVLSGIGSMLSDYNTAFENGVRLAAYKAAIDKGLSKEKAASLAKNLTVNFNRKGDIALQAGALYAFFNASVQGTARILQTMTRIENGKIVITPLGNKIIRGGLLLGVVQAVALAAAGFDDDNPPQFVREKNIIIPLMNGKYLTVPMPLGFNLLPNLSRNVTEWGMSGFKNTPKRITSLLESVLTGLNPFGGGFSVQTLVPTVIDPLVALAENKDSFGRKIAREDFSSLRETPGYLRTKDTATPWSKGLSEFLNYASGGTKYMKGALSPTPDQIDYLIGQATGGVGRELGKISQTVSSTATGEELPSTKIPLVSRFYGDTEESASQSNKYYTNLSRINSYAAEIKGRIGHPGTGTVSEFIQDVPEARLVPLATATYSAIQKIEKLKKQAIERNLPKERIRQFEKLAQDRMKQFNQRVDAFQR